MVFDAGVELILKQIYNELKNKDSKKDDIINKIYNRLNKPYILAGKDISLNLMCKIVNDYYIITMNERQAFYTMNLYHQLNLEYLNNENYNIDSLKRIFLDERYKNSAYVILDTYYKYLDKDLNLRPYIEYNKNVFELKNELIEKEDKTNQVQFDYIITERISEDLNEYMAFLQINDFSNVQIVKQIKNLLNHNKTKMPQITQTILENKIITKLTMISSFYENMICCDVENRNTFEDRLFNELQSVENIGELLKIYNDYEEIIIENFCDFYCEFLDKFNIRKRIISMGKQDDVLKLNPYLSFEYRKFYGILFENEQLDSIKKINEIKSIIDDIDSYMLTIEPQTNMNILDIFKYINLTCDSLINSFPEDASDSMLYFIIGQVYENLILNEKNLEQPMYKYIIDLVESDKSKEQVVSIIKNNNILLISILYLFRSNNIAVDQIKKLKKERLNSEQKGKKKIIKKYNCYYEADNKYLKSNK